MNNQRQNLCLALSIANSLFIFIFLLFLIEGLNLSFLFKFGFIPVLFIIGALKIYWMGAISGGALEIITQEESVFKVRRLHRNAMAMAPAFLVVFIVIGLIDFLLFALFAPWSHLWSPVFFSLCAALAAYGVVNWAVHKKYTAPLRIPRRTIKFNGSFLMVMLSACLLQMVLMRVSDHVHFGGFYWRNIFAFIFSYIHVFEFIFCALFVVDQYPQIKENFNPSHEIILINPMAAEIFHSLGFRLIVPWYPPVFVILKALTPKKYHYREFNQVIWHDRYYKSNALVCITTFTTNCYEAYKIAKEFKKRGAKVVMGGPHVTYLPNEALAFCDSVIIGQAEGVWKQVLEDYENGTLKAQYRGAASEADYAQVHQELLNSPPSIVRDFLETTRGCKFRCHFCSVPALSGGQVRLAAINDIVDLVKKIKPHANSIKFIDNNIYSDPGYAKELFSALKPLNIKWRSACTIDIAKNEETLRLAKESGCVGLFFGYEVSGDSFEKNLGGKFGMAKKYLEYTRTIKKSGIKISGAFIFGFDSDSLKSFFSLWKFAVSVMPVFSHVAMLTPLPGSVLFREMLNQDRIINLNWRSHDYNKLVVRHPLMDHALVSLLFPVLRIFFFLTTSLTGLMLLLVVLLVIFHYATGYSF